MRTYIISILITLTLLSIYSCNKAGLFYFEDPHSSEPIVFDNGDITLINHGAKTGKSILKYVKPITSTEEYKQISGKFEKLKHTFRCTLSEQSMVCLVFGNEFVNLISRNQDRDTIAYKVKVRESMSTDNMTIEFSILEKSEDFDKDFMMIIGIF